MVRLISGVSCEMPRNRNLIISLRTLAINRVSASAVLTTMKDFERRRKRRNSRGGEAGVGNVG